MHGSIQRRFTAAGVRARFDSAAGGAASDPPPGAAAARAGGSIDAIYRG
jgi:hypothetical protein